MTYDLSGPYDGWVTWFNSPISDGGYTFPSTGGPVPSINRTMRNFTNAGVAAGKLGLGLPFYGYAWTGAPGFTQPRQGWGSGAAPTVTTPAYQTIVNTYYQSNRYHWDTNAQAAYLSVTNTPASNDMFISYDDAYACQAKVSDARNLGLGGIMIWELSQDYFSNRTGSNQWPLLLALNQALDTPRILSAGRQGGNLTFTFSTLPLASYRVLWASNWRDLGTR